MMPVKKNVLFAVDWYDYDIHAGVSAYAREAGWVLYDHRTYSDIESAAYHVPRAWSGDGIIALVNRDDSSTHQLVRDARVPVVDLVDEVMHLEVPRVIADNEAIGAMGAKHLMDIGYKHLAFVRLIGARVIDNRMAGFRDTVLLAGKHFHLVDFQRAPRSLTMTRDLVPWMASRLGRIPRPFGLMMHHDGESMAVFLACDQAGLNIPDDIALISVDNNELRCELGPVALTSIDRNLRRHGYESAALLDRLMNGEAPPAETVKIPPKEVVVRKSTDVLAFQDAEMRRTMAYLRSHCAEPDLDVEKVIEASGMSRRKLYYLFEKHTGRGIHEELVHLRLKEAMHLLASTDMKVFAVAMRAGFSSERQLAHVCRRELGMSPRQYRDQSRAKPA